MRTADIYATQLCQDHSDMHSELHLQQRTAEVVGWGRGGGGGGGGGELARIINVSFSLQNLVRTLPGK